VQIPRSLWTIGLSRSAVVTSVSAVCKVFLVARIALFPGLE